MPLNDPHLFPWKVDKGFQGLHEGIVGALRSQVGHVMLD